MRGGGIVCGEGEEREMSTLEGVMTGLYWVGYDVFS